MQLTSIRHWWVASLFAASAPIAFACENIVEVEQAADQTLPDGGNSVNNSTTASTGSTVVTGGGTAGSSVEGPPMMSADEAEAWCEWYVFTAYPNSDINPAPAPQPERAGFIDGYESLYCYGGPWTEGACLMRPTVADCVRNILHTFCEATVQDLNDCVAGMITGNQVGSTCPLPGTCDAFAQANGCDHTVVLELSGVGCKLPVE